MGGGSKIWGSAYFRCGSCSLNSCRGARALYSAAPCEALPPAGGWQLWLHGIQHGIMKLSWNYNCRGCLAPATKVACK